MSGAREGGESAGIGVDVAATRTPRTSSAESPSRNGFVVGSGVIITTLSGESLHRFDGESITPAFAPFSSLFAWPLTADGGRASGRASQPSKPTFHGWPIEPQSTNDFPSLDVVADGPAGHGTPKPELGTQAIETLLSNQRLTIMFEVPG